MELKEKLKLVLQVKCATVHELLNTNNTSLLSFKNPLFPSDRSVVKESLLSTLKFLVDAVIHISIIQTSFELCDPLFRCVFFVMGDGLKACLISVRFRQLAISFRSAIIRVKATIWMISVLVIFILGF